MSERVRNPQTSVLNRPAWAKINLCLEIIGRRDDNYHDITSVIQAINLHDSLDFVLTDNGEITLDCDDPALTAEGEGNLVLKAARLLQKSEGVTWGAHITLRKRIPMSAGIGGGSSDAAATLLGLSDLWDLRMRKGDLVEMAASLGSDVPFFLEGTTALVEGRGERVTRIPSPPPGWAVLVCPRYDLKDKTKKLYSSLTHNDLSEGIVTHRLIAALVAGRFPDSSLLFNAFERAAYSMFGNLLGTRQVMARASGRDVHLSGSGPTLFTLYPDSQQAQAARLHSALLDANQRAYLTRLVTERRKA